MWSIVVTFDLGRVTTVPQIMKNIIILIVVTFDLGRVTTAIPSSLNDNVLIVVTFDLGRVTTSLKLTIFLIALNCGDVRSRTSYNYP